MGFGLLTSVTWAVPPNFERYKVILDKAPFGQVEVVAPIQPAPPPTVNQPLWVKQFRLSMLQEDWDGTLILGLVNNTTKKSIMLREGESDPETGIKFIAADYEASTATISKDGDVRQLGADQNQVAVAAPQPTTSSATTKSASTRSSRATSYAQRRAARQKHLADLRKQRETSNAKPPALPEPVLQQHLQNMQMEAIRKGAPPLPVPLTPAMEQQLIKEGVITN